MRKIILFIFILSGLALNTFSQTVGNIEVFQNSKIEELLKLHLDYNDHSKGIAGWRVQIFFDSGNNSRSKADKIKTEFLSKHPDVEAYRTFQPPNYKVRVGDFRTKLDAERFLKIIEKEYPNSYPVADIINFPKL